MEKRTGRLATLIAELNETLKEEETFWKANWSEETRILESLLVEFKTQHLLGEIGEDECKRKSEVIGIGLVSLREPKTVNTKNDLMSVPPIQLAEEGLLKEEAETDLGKEDEGKPSEALPETSKDLKAKNTHKNRDFQSKPKKKIKNNKESMKIESSGASEGHCMNPWKQGCRKTDIELSIYYNGKLTPICHECWEEISKKNIEWSGL